MSNDNALGTALWLAAGGAAGYAAARWVVPPTLTNRTTMTAAALKPGTWPKAPRALATGPSGSMTPIDPYADDVRSTTPTSITNATMPSKVIVATTPSLPTSESSSGPITHPSQLDTRTESRPFEQPRPVAQAPSISFATSARVRSFDSVFEQYRGDLPIEYIRALVERESNGQPSVRAGSAIGLMQIVPVVLDDYNKRHGTKYRSEHLTHPSTNVAIGCELLRLIVESYRKNHPRITTLQADWSNPRFVELLTFGWNAGFSEAGGVGRVARHLEGLGAVDISIDQVASHAKLAGSSKHLSNPAKIAWCKSVVALYQRERAFARAFAST